MPGATEAFVHLQVHSAFSYGDGASGVDELVLRAASAGMPALALTDTASVTGIPGFVDACGRAGLRPIAGAEIDLEGLGHIVLLADGPEGFRSLCRILSAAGLRDRRRTGPVACWADLEEHGHGLACHTGEGRRGLAARLVRGRRRDELSVVLDRLRSCFPSGDLLIAASRTLEEGERGLSRDLFALADHAGLPVVAVNAVRHAVKSGLAAHEALRRIALHLAPADEHPDLPVNGERWLKDGAAMARLFPDRPDALENTVRLAERLAAPLDPSRRHLPRFPRLPPGASAFSHLAELVHAGARRRWPRGLAPAARERLATELETIRDLGYCDYFLVCHDLCEEARRRRLGFGLRGSAIGSAVAYCLGMSPHDPIARRISFERFLSRARRKPPDIDIDFRHDSRDAIAQYTRDTYGHAHTALVANYVRWQGRSLLRDLGKALGFDTAEVDRLRSLLWHSRGHDLAHDIARQPELRALGIDPDRHADLFALCAHLSGLPRHLGTHSSGIVISDVPLADVAPLRWAAKGVPVVAFDKDDVEAPGVGLLKIDQLCLRALTAVDLAVGSIRARTPEFDYDGRDREDPETLAMVRAARTVGVFQLESPAQMALQWRLKADRFDDLVASVALIRPGPLVGRTVEPWLAARHGLAPPRYPLPELEPVLAETWGRIVYQDQVLDVVKVVGGFGPDEADAWLKTMTHARDEREMERLGAQLRERAKAKGLAGARFETLWTQIRGFSRYGFCHGHALAFADHGQGTAYLLRHHPADFLAGVLSVEPCGFWPVETIVAEARRRGVDVLGPCLNRSDPRHWKVEDGAIRCSLAFVRGVSEVVADAIVAERDAHGAFSSLPEAARRLAFVERDTLEWLVLGGAFDTLGVPRRQALWSLPGIHRPGAPADGGLDLAWEAPLAPQVAEFQPGERLVLERRALGFATAGHPVAALRPDLRKAGCLACADLQNARPRTRVTVAGLCLRPHRPPTPSGQVFVFLTLEDETGLAQVTVPPDAYQRCGAALFGHALLAVVGLVERRGAGMVLRAIDAGPA